MKKLFKAEVYTADKSGTYSVFVTATSWMQASDLLANEMNFDIKELCEVTWAKFLEA